MLVDVTQAEVVAEGAVVVGIGEEAVDLVVDCHFGNLVALSCALVLGHGRNREECEGDEDKDSFHGIAVFCLISMCGGSDGRA